MIKIHNVEVFFDIIIANRFYSNKSRLAFKLQSFFGKIKFEGLNVLDIGGGYGLLSFYEAVNGAKKVICMEPAADGSSSGIIDIFNKIKTQLNINNVSLINNLFQNYIFEEKFDLIIIHNSINHLNEVACINIQNNAVHYDEYKEYFSKINSMLNQDGHLIISDCSRYNFWKIVGLKNPFDPGIEWHKHQSPFLWSKLLTETGFKVTRIKWNSFNRFGNLGKILTGNIITSYFLTSHFTIYTSKE